MAWFWPCPAACGEFVYLRDVTTFSLHDCVAAHVTVKWPVSAQSRVGNTPMVPLWILQLSVEHVIKYQRYYSGLEIGYIVANAK